MRKSIFYVSVLSVLFSVVSCGNDDKRIREEIIGSYSYTNEKETDVILVKVEGVETFNEDGIVEDESIVTLSFSKEGLGAATMLYRIESTGEYEIKNSRVIYDYNNGDDNVNVELISAEGSEGSEALIDDINSQMGASFVADFKARIENENGAEIFELNAEQLVLLNPDGEKIVKPRIVD